MQDQDQWVFYKGNRGPGEGKHIVLISGDEEYRSEEALPALAKILAVHHGFSCTVLFAIDPETGEIDPDNQTNIPGLFHLETADMMVLFTRFRELPDEDMKYIVDYTNVGKPVMGLRTATHAFKYTRNPSSPYAIYDCSGFGGGYGRQVLGETWVSHYGHHGVESNRGRINPDMKDHPILRGVDDIWGPSDVYTVNELTEDPDVLVFGEVLKGMNPTDEVNEDKPALPMAWIKTHHTQTGNKSRVFCTTSGSSVDLANEGFRRLLVNGCYWCMGIEARIPKSSEVSCVGEYKPTMFASGKFKKKVKPSDLQL